MTDQSTSGYAPPPPPPDPGYAPPPPPGTPPPPRPQLRRTPAGRRALGGVATGLADYFGIDPVLVRVGFVVLTVLSGTGIVLYLALWLFLPEEGEPDSVGERFLHNNTALAVTLAVVLGLFVVAPVLAWGWWGHGPGLLGLTVAVAAAVVVVAVARRDQHPAAPSHATSTTPPDHAVPTGLPAQPGPAPASVAAPASTRTGWRAPAAPAEPIVPKPPKQRSVLGALTLSVALVVVGALVALDLAGAAGSTAVTVLSAALLVVALGLLVGTVVGRSRGLIALGVVLVLLLVPLAALPRGLRAGDGAGDRAYQPTSVAELQDAYRLGAGQLLLDLSNVDFTGVSEQVDVSVGAGQILVYVPSGVTVSVDARAGVGNLRLAGEGDHAGVGVQQTWSVDPARATGTLVLDLQVGLGEVQVSQSHPTLPEMTR